MLRPRVVAAAGEGHHPHGSKASASAFSTRAAAARRRSNHEDAVTRARKIKGGLLVLALVCLRVLVVAFLARPRVTLLATLWLFGVAFFVSTESSSGVLHASQKTENKFWMFMSTAICVILLFLADDSPVRVPLSATGVVLGVFIIVVSTYLVHFAHKRSHRQSLENRASIPKNKSYREAISSLADRSTSLEDLVSQVNAAISKLESAIIPGGFRRLMDRNAFLSGEKQLLDLFQNASRAELNYLVMHINMNVLIYRVKNRHKGTITATKTTTTTTTAGAALLSSQVSTPSSGAGGFAPPASARQQLLQRQQQQHRLQPGGSTEVSSSSSSLASASSSSATLRSVISMAPSGKMLSSASSSASGRSITSLLGAPENPTLEMVAPSHAAALAVAPEDEEDDHNTNADLTDVGEEEPVITPPNSRPASISEDPASMSAAPSSHEYAPKSGEGANSNRPDTEEEEDDFFTFGGEDELNSSSSKSNKPVATAAVAAPPSPSYEDSFESDMAKGNHRNALLELLVVNRLHELTISARASILDAIQVVGMTRNPLTRERAQRWAAGIILDTKGDQLSELKTITDAKGSVHSMHKLVYNDITNPSIRASLLQHFQANKRSKLGRKVLSDVDDTFLCSGGRYPAGIDETYPRHAIYPAAGAFYEGLDRGMRPKAERKLPENMYGSLLDLTGNASLAPLTQPVPPPQSRPDSSGYDSEGSESSVHGGSSSSPNRAQSKAAAAAGAQRRMAVGNLVFLSARPHVYKDMAEKRVYNKFERFIQAKNLHAMPTLLPGDLESGQAYMLRGDFEPMAQKKLKNMLEYHSIFPEFTHVFVCDNGQADVRAAELMKERLGPAMEVVYVHKVQPIDKTFGYTPANFLKWQAMGIVFYTTFVGAAADACERGLINTKSLRSVCVSATREFAALVAQSAGRFPGGMLGVEERRMELATDMERANALLERDNCLPVSPPRALCLFPIGVTVFTQSFGEGFVRMFRPHDGMYEVVLLRGLIVGYFTAKDLRSVPWAHVAVPGGGMFAGSNEGTAQAGVQVGSKVSTPFGEGVVRRYRPKDKMFEVTMTKWRALAFLREADVALAPAVEEEKRSSSSIWGLGKKLVRRTFSRSSPVMAAASVAQHPSPPPLAPPRATAPSPIPVIEPGSRVLVRPFGRGVVQGLREDGGGATPVVVVVRFDDWNAVGYVRTQSVQLLSPAPTPNPTPSPPATTITTSTATKPPSSKAARVMSAMFGGNGSRVITPYGPGEIVLPSSSSSSSSSPSPSRSENIVLVRLDWGANAYLNKDSFTVQKATVTSRILSLLASSPKATTALTKRAFASGPSPSTAEASSPTTTTTTTTTTTQQQQPPEGGGSAVSAADEDTAVAVGDVVSTPYGTAVVDAIRANEDFAPICVTFVNWNAKAYLTARQVVVVAKPPQSSPSSTSSERKSVTDVLLHLLKR